LVAVLVAVLAVTQKAVANQDWMKGVQLPLEPLYMILPQSGLIPTNRKPDGAPAGTVTTQV
jgi:hypothetical protein